MLISICQRLDPQAIRFIVPGEPLGYRTAGRYGHNKVSVRVHAWNDAIRDAATSIGVSTPLFCDKAYPVIVDIRAYYSSRLHCDPGNTHKGLIDALFYKSTSGDKYTGGAFDLPYYDKENPRTLVELRGWILKKKHSNLVSESWEHLER